MVTYGDVVVSQFVKVFQILATARPKGVWTKLNIPQIFRDNKPNPGICLGSRCTVQTYWWHDVVLMCAMGFFGVVQYFPSRLSKQRASHQNL